MDFEDNLYEDFFNETDSIFLRFSLRDINEIDIFNARITNEMNNIHCNKCNGNYSDGIVRRMFYRERNGQDIFVNFCEHCERIVH